MKVYLEDIRNRYPEFEIDNYDKDAYFTGFNHDSREIKDGDIFIPIVGERFDGHDFIIEALDSGASMSLCESGCRDKVMDTDKPIIYVDSIREGLEKILNYAISPITAPVIGITGSTGKTTTRQMLVSILGSKKKVLSSDLYNTVWGNAVLFSQYKDENFIVLECGMDSKGEIAWHVNAEDPDIGILLNVGHVHAGKLGSIEDVYQEKKNMADYMKKTGKPLILNIDDELLVRILDDYNSEVITFGKNIDADFRIKETSVSQVGTDFVFEFKGSSYYVKLNVFGEDLAYNAVASIACANRLGFSIEDCIEGLKNFKPNNGRFEVINFKNDLVVVNDAYNANPTSMKMSLETFSKLFKKDDYYRICILGDMKELGDVTREKHEELGELVESYSFDEVYFVGEYFEFFNKGEYISSADEASAFINNRIDEFKGKKVAILLKASNGIGLYRIPDFLKKLGIS